MSQWTEELSAPSRRRYSIPAHETVYGGYRMRSKLEVAWARVFDGLGHEWKYEPERHELPSGSYLPDFLVDLNPTGTSKMWVEVKGPEPLEREMWLCAELSIESGIPVNLVQGRQGQHNMWLWKQGRLVMKTA